MAELGVRLLRFHKRIFELKPHPKLKDNLYLHGDWQLEDYQFEGIVELSKISRPVLGDDTGIGKTVESLTTFAYKKLKEPQYRGIFIVPTVSVFQWVSEIQKFTSFKVMPVESKGSIEDRKELFDTFFKEDYDILVIPHSLLHKRIFLTDKKGAITGCVSQDSEIYHCFKLIEKYKDKYKYFIAIDEATCVRCAKSNIFTNCKYLSFRYGDYVVCMTATILYKQLLDARNIFHVADPRVFDNIYSFMNIYFKKMWVPRLKKKVPNLKQPTNLELFKENIMGRYIARKKTDIKSGQIPHLIRDTFNLRCSDSDTRIYSLVENSVEETIDDDGKVKPMSFWQLGQLFFLSQIVLDVPIFEGTKFEDDFKNKELKKFKEYMQEFTYPSLLKGKDYTVYVPINNVINTKAEYVLSLMQDYGSKFIVFSRYLYGLDYLTKVLYDKGYRIGSDFIRITGFDNYKTKNGSDREKAIKLFQENSGVKLALISSAGEASLNLQAANLICFYNLPYTAGAYIQLVGRIHRLFSKHDTVSAISLLSWLPNSKQTVEHDTWNVIRGELNLIEKTLGTSIMDYNETHSLIQNTDDFVKQVLIKMKQRIKGAV